ncbi:MAG: sigma-70 family RNA polymerase sigma factor [Opitutaceae bacterium]|nr:sigma-70 family RNA polymerase sigma factor [Opitutaceae bacterium]
MRAYLQKRFPVLSDHDDLVQEAYTRVIHAHRQGRLTSVKAFLFTVTRNLAIDMFRRRGRTSNHEPISDVAALPALDEAADPVASLELQRRREVLIEAVASLPERCREVMMLRHLDGMHYKEIAERLGISPHTVKVHIVKGVRDCTTYFRKRGLFDAEAPSAIPEDSVR